MISGIFNVADKVFALTLVQNEGVIRLDQPNNQYQTSTSGKNRKRFCDPKSGAKEGWNNYSKDLFSYLCQEITKVRSEPETGEQLEIMMRHTFAGRNTTFSKTFLVMNLEQPNVGRSVSKHRFLLTESQFYCKILKKEC